MRANLPWAALLAIIVLGLSIPVRASDSVQVLEDCASLHLPLAPTGIDSLRLRCPNLERAVLELGLADQLGPDWQSRINRTAVSQLAQLFQRYRSQPLSNAPHIDSLSQVMLALQTSSAHKSRWQMIKDWLSLLLRQPQRNMGWLQRLLAQLNLPSGPTRVLSYAAIATVLSLTLWIVWRELKAMGTLASRPARTAKAIRQRLPTGAIADMQPPDLEALAPWQRPAALLAALIQALRHSGRLGLEHALTHRELGERGAFDDGVQRTRFVSVSLLAERELYGAQTLTEVDSQIAQVLADGLALHGQLRAAPVARA